MEVLLVPADADRPDEADGLEVVRKTATLPSERIRLLREAEVLAAAADRGVPGLPTVVSRPSADTAEPCLVTAAAAGPSLAVAAPLPVVEVAGVAAEVAAILGGLHEAGLVHGAVEPSHVVLDGAGGAVLVGLGNGGPVSAPALDPSDGHLDPADDVAAWGLLVAHLLDWSATTDDEPLVALRQALGTRRARRRGRPPAPPRADGDQRRVLAALADQAQDPDSARRPSARALAAAIAHRIPAARVPRAVSIATSRAPVPGGLLDRLSAHVPGDHAPHGEPSGVPWSPPTATVDGVTPRTATRRRRSTSGRTSRPGARTLLVPITSRSEPAGAAEAAPAAASTAPVESNPGPPGRWAMSGRYRWVRPGAVLAIVLLGASAAIAGLRAPEPAGSGAAGRPPARPCPPAPPPAADADGDGCEEPVRWADGVLHAGLARFGLGAPGDAWAVGDWDCDGRRTPALLHGGALLVFDAWPGHAAELQGRQVATAAGATGLTTVAGPSGCEQVALERPGSADLVVDPRQTP